MRIRSMSILILMFTATTPAFTQVINGCVSTSGALRILPSGDSCRTNELPVSWNAAGPQGPQGPQGAQGAEGPQGPQGPPGPPATVAPPQTFGTMTFSGFSGTFAVSAIGGSMFRDGSGARTVNPMTVTRELDFASPALFVKLMAQNPFASIVITTSAGRKIELCTAQVVGYELLELPGSAKVYEKISILGQKMILTIDGVVNGWDFVRDTPAGPPC